MKIKLLVLLVLASFSSFAQYTLIPDVNFESKLITLGIDSGKPDGKVLTSKISSLTSLDVSVSSITDLTGIQDFVGLTNLNCYNNKLTALDVTKNVALTTLDCGLNQLASVDFSKNTSLTYLNCTNMQQLTALDVSKNVSLLTLYCYNNKLTALDISKNTALSTLQCSGNQISVLDVSQNIALKTLTCTSNQLTTLDFSKNISLTGLNCSSNQLINLNLKNGKNTILLNNKASNFTNNPNLTCIQVDDVSYSNTNWSALKDAVATYNTSCDSQNTLIPDSKFEDKLIALGIDTDGKNGYVLTSSIDKIKSLDVSNLSIASLVGIQNFSALISLNCNSNNLKGLDISKNIALKDLDCHNNQLINLDVSKNIALIDLDCSYNQLTNLDVSKNIALADLECGHNQLTNLDVSNNTALDYLDCTFNKLTNLNISNTTLIGYLLCDNNQLTTLDVSKNIILTYLAFSSNQITSIDVSKNTILSLLSSDDNPLKTLDVSKNTALTILSCDSNQLTNLDVSQNIALYSLTCKDNLLTSLNLKNGHSTKLVTANFTKNPNLSCIQVDYLPYFKVNHANAKDATASYSEDCLSSSNSVKISSEFEDKLIVSGIDTDGKNGQVLLSSIDKITTLDVSSSSISDLTGIQYFYALTSLNCDNNQLANLDVTFNPSLTSLSCDGNLLTILNLLNNKSLIDLNCNNNQLTKLDLSKNTVLKTLSFKENQLTILDTSKNIALTDLNCNNNEIRRIDVSKNTALTTLYCNNNAPLKSLNLKNGNNTKLVNGDFKNNSNLSCVQVDDIAYSDANWSNFKEVTTSYSGDCPDYYTSIPDVNFEKKLIALRIDSGTTDGRVLTSKIETVTSLNVSSSSINDLTGIQYFSALKSLTCSSNQLTNLDVSKNTLLTNLDCGYNQLTALDVSKNSSLDMLTCMNNSLKSIDISKNIVLTSLYCPSNQLTSLNLKNGNNINFDAFNTYFIDNPNLSCIQVDNIAYANANWSHAKDATASYSESCAVPSVEISNEFEDKLIALGIDTDGKNGSVLLADITDVKSIDVSNSGIISLSGIEYFTDLETLICKGNALTTINVSYNTALKYLDCSSNPITALDLSKNKLLVELYCNGLAVKLNKTSNSKISGSTSLTSLDLSNNLLLTKLDCSDNQIVSLDLSQNTLLTDIDCSNNKLASLNVKNGNNTKLLNVNFKTNTSLSCIQVDDDVYANANWAGAKDVTATYSKTTCTLGIENVVYNQITVYPNPVKSELHIDNITLEKATVYDALGKLVKITKFSNASLNNTIDLSGLPQGIYYIYLESEGNTIVKKIVVE